MKNSSLAKMTNKRRSALRLGFVVAALASHAAAGHTFFEGMVSMDVNPRNQHLEIVHSYTTHDVTALLMEQTQLAINLEHPEHEALLRQYIEQHFLLRTDDTPIHIDWVGIRITPQQIEIYQEVMNPPALSRLEVQNNVLRSALAQQVNRVNFSQGPCRGSLVFDRATSNYLPIKAPCLKP